MIGFTLMWTQTGDINTSTDTNALLPTPEGLFATLATAGRLLAYFFSLSSVTAQKSFRILTRSSLHLVSKVANIVQGTQHFAIGRGLQRKRGNFSCGKK